MKSIKIIVAIGLCLLLAGCNYRTKSSINTGALQTVIIDITDALVVPDEPAFYNSIDSNIWEPLTVNITCITENDVNKVSTLSLPAENYLFGNRSIREARIMKFKKDVHLEIEKLIAKGQNGQQHSIIYRTVAKQMNWLSQQKGNHKSVYLYSDLLENDDLNGFNFYSPVCFKLLQTNPALVQKSLEQSCRLNNLKGVELYLIFTPKTYTENFRYIILARFFKRVFESHGASVFIGMQ